MQGLLKSFRLITSSALKAREPPMDTAVAQTRLVAVVRQLAVEKRADLDKHKENHADIALPDFLWHYLLQSFATMGRSAGWHGLIGNRSNYDRVKYPALQALPAADRRRVAREVCWAAKVRMPDRKGDYIVGCFDRVSGMGGPEAAKAQLLTRQAGRPRYGGSRPCRASVTSTPGTS